MLTNQPLPIAQVQTPEGATWYIAQAHDFHGFAVQRCYQRAGEPWGSKYYFSGYLRPFFNLAAVAAAGRSAQELLQWSLAHPGEIFTHPEYASLCLKWGPNAHGYHVGEMAAMPINEEQVPFTPRTCWQSGITYYQLAIPDAENKDEFLLLALLRELAGLERHEWECGQEGTWRGWYATDRPAVERVLASLGRTLVLAQPHLQYGVWVQLKPGDHHRQLVAAYATTEEAHAHFRSLPMPEAHRRGEYPQVTFGYSVQWLGQPEDWNITDAKYLEEQAALTLVAQQPVWSGPVAPMTYVGCLDLLELPVYQSMPFIAKVLAGSNLARPEQAAALGWTLRELQERENNPELLTVDELDRIADLAGWSLSELVTQLGQHLQVIHDAQREVRLEQERQSKDFLNGL